MELLAGLGSILFNAAGGGVFGIIGGLVQKFLDIRAQGSLANTQLAILKENNAHALSMRDKDLAYLQAEIAGGAAIAEIRARGETDVASFGAIAKSYDADKRTYTTDKGADKYAAWFACIDVVRGLTRPALTAFLNFVLVIMTCFVIYMLIKQMPELLKVPSLGVKDTSALVDLFTRLMDALIFMSSTSTMWWFAARGVDPRGRGSKET